MATEIYKIKFNKFVEESNNAEGSYKTQRHMQYTLGVTGLVDGELLTPVKIKLKDDKVIVFFSELGIRHEFTRTADVEIFYRDKVKKDENKDQACP